MMSEITSIEWCDRSWSPWEGCTKKSPGCANCYAEARNHRWENDNWGKGKPRRLTADSGWKKPLQWIREAEKADKRITVFPSLCDPFDEEVPIEWLERFLTMIDDTPHLRWLLLTKRPEMWYPRLSEFDSAWTDCVDFPERGDVPENVWIGTSVEDQERADERIPELLKIPAAGRFLSVEPLLGPVDLLYPCFNGSDPIRSMHGIDWVIVGGESGPGARPCNVGWIRDIVRQCQAAKVPCFVKQVGSKPIALELELWEREGRPENWFPSDSHVQMKIRHPKGGDPSEWPADLRVRQFPEGTGQRVKRRPIPEPEEPSPDSRAKRGRFE